MRLIDAEEFIEWLLDHIWDEDEWDANRNALDELILRKLSALGYISVIGDIYVRKRRRKEKTKTVNAEPIRHGHWIEDRLCSTNGGTYGVRRCSNCEYYYNDFGDEWNYCPDCGAKMDEVEE